MRIAVARLSAVACSVFMSGSMLWVPSLAIAQTPVPQPAAQPAYPSTPAPRNRVNASKDAPAQKPDEARCANLKGLEKAECERRDTTDDDAPAGVTSSMRQKQKEEEKNTADASTAPANDTAKQKPSTAKSSEDAAAAEKRTSPSADDKATSADESDTLGKPPT